MCPTDLVLSVVVLGTEGCTKARGDAGGDSIGPARWRMARLACGARLVGQMSRILLGVLLPFITRDGAAAGWSEVAKGEVLSAFAAGYILTQIAGGAMADRLGAKLPLAVALAAVSVGTLLAPVAAAAGGPAWLWWVYFAMGVLEGPSFPSTGAFLSKWFPAEEKATANSWAAAGGALGGLAAMGLGPLVADAVGWRGAFALFGACGCGFTAAWVGWAADSPAGYPLGEEEVRYLRQRGVLVETDGSRRSTTFPWHIFGHPCVWAVCGAHAVYNFGRYFVYAWIPLYYVERLGASPGVAAACMACLQVADAGVKMTAGRAADRLVTKGRLTLLGLRKGASCVGFACFAAAMAGCGAAEVRRGTAAPTGTGVSPDIVLTTLLLTAAKCASALHTAGFETNYLDLSVRHTGALVGVGNSLATAASLAAPLLAGHVVAAGGWAPMFFIVTAANVAGAVGYGLWAETASRDMRDA